MQIVEFGLFKAENLELQTQANRLLALDLLKFISCYQVHVWCYCNNMIYIYNMVTKIFHLVWDIVLIFFCHPSSVESGYLIRQQRSKGMPPQY